MIYCVYVKINVSYKCSLCSQARKFLWICGVITLAYDMTSFRVQTEVSASPTFFGWVFGFNGKVQILAPESVKEQYRQMIAKADEDMQERVVIRK